MERGRAARDPNCGIRSLARASEQRQAKVRAAIALLRLRGPGLGRPHVDVIHGSRLHKLKELRIDRSARVLFAFDSKRNPVMLIGGDKAGKWNRWYPPMIQRAERLYLAHERSNGKEPPEWNRDAGRGGPPRSH